MQTVKIMEVGPRDGWQNLKSLVPTEQKLNIIRGILATGIQYMQVTSFVNPKAIPQMYDSSVVAETIVQEFPDRTFNALVPNLVGAKKADETGLREICYVVSVSESHNQANIKRSREQSFAELAAIREQLPDMKVTLSLATAFGCPFEGEIHLKDVLKNIEKAVSLGIRKVELADTIGIANPVQVRQTFQAVTQQYPDVCFLAHMHDTRNNGIINSWAAAENGAEIIHTTLGGLGGCPFAPGASGNTATEDLVYLFEHSGIHTGINFAQLIKVSREMYESIEGNYSGHQIKIPSESTL